MCVFAQCQKETATQKISYECLLVHLSVVSDIFKMCRLSYVTLGKNAPPKLGLHVCAQAEAYMYTEEVIP